MDEAFDHVIALVNEGSQSRPRGFVERDNEKNDPRPVFFFGRVAGRDNIASDSGKVCRTVTLLGAIIKNKVYYFWLVSHPTERAPDGLLVIHSNQNLC